jgi:hypothetical protein
VTATSPTTSEASRWISAPRFAPFILEGDGGHARAVKLYEWDGALAAACLEVVRNVEVLLRNSIHAELRSTRPSNALRSWLLDPDLLDAGELGRVNEAIAHAKRSKHELTEDRVVAALPFGFWARLLGTRYEELWRHTLRAAFPNGDGTRRQIAGFVNRIAQFRNRLAHHESLLDQPVADRHRDMLSLAAAISGPASTWIGARSRVPRLLAARP